jgi:putative transposase
MVRLEITSPPLNPTYDSNIRDPPMEYRRHFLPGGTYFFTLVTYQRRPIFSTPEAVEHLRYAFGYTLARMPFTIVASVVLPDHMHFIWTLPPQSGDFSTRWRLIKSHFEYIHYNPVKHGLVNSVAEWPYSSFMKYVQDGLYAANWGENAKIFEGNAGME